MNVYSLCALCGSALLLASCEEVVTTAQLSGPTMGTTWSLQASGADAGTRALIQQHLDQRQAVFSHWKDDSALSQFNASLSTDWYPVPLELVRVVQVAHDIAQQTDGVLDVTVAPLVDAWGFGAKSQSREKPGLQHIGWEHLRWRLEPPALKKDDAQVRINVASVTEGFVVDELVLMLKQRGLTDFLLEVGGEIAAIGHAPDGGPWRVGIQTPNAETGEALETLPLTNLCVATSGSYRHRFEKEGRSYSHLMDPRTGRPISHRLVSVTVIHQSCVLADGYATALMVLGPERGRDAARRLGLRVIWIEEQ